MNRIAAFLLSLLLLPVAALAAGTPAATPATPGTPTLTIINWEEFLTPDLVRQFEKRENARVKLVYFSTVEESLRLARRMGGQADILVGGMVVTAQLKRENRLARLERFKLTHVKPALPQFQLDPDYAVPYLWGYTGFAWVPSKVKSPPKTYADLLALARANPGRVALTDDGMEFAHAIVHMYGTPPHDPENPAQVKAALAKYRAEGEKLFVIKASDYEDTNPFLTGEIIAGQVYNGDMAWLRRDRNFQVGYANPSPGCFFWEENLMLLAKAPQPELAYRFLNFISEAKTAARNAEAMYYAAGNPLAASYYDMDYLSDPIILPRVEATAACRVNRPARDPQTQTFFDSLKPTGLNRK